MTMMAGSVGQEVVHNVLAERGNKILGAGKVKLHGFRLFHLEVLTSGSTNQEEEGEKRARR